MRTTPLQPAQARRRRRRRPLWPWLLGALVIAAGAAAGTGLVRAALLSGKTLPGTTLLGVAVDGRGGTDLEQRLRAVALARLDRPVTLVAGSGDAAGRVTVRPAQVLQLDAVRTAAAARDAGRGSLWTQAAALLLPLPPERDVVPRLRVRADGLAAVARQLSRFGTPPRDAAVVVVGTTPRVVAGAPGTAPDPEQLAAVLIEAVLAGDDGPLTVALRPAQPRIGDDAARAVAGEVRAMLAAPVALRVGGAAAGRLLPEEIAAAVRVRAQGGRLVPQLVPSTLAGPLRSRLERFRSTGKDARFVVKGRRVAIVPSTAGRDVQPGPAAAAVLAALRSPERTARLSLVPVPARFSTADARKLGVRQQVSSFTTDMGVSTANRIHNVQLMADYIDGTLILPGEIFSFNRVVGPRSVERGFKVGQAIYGTVAVASIGGGVCQTATTMFNNAFELGLPILSRFNHTTYIDHYPLGRDATVSWGGPDLVFRNDLPTALLVKARYTDETLTFTFYGTPSGRRVVARTSPRTNIVPPQLRYALDLNAPAGSVRTSPGTGEEGFDVVVTRQVWDGDRPLGTDRFRSRYLDQGPTRIYGPGQEVPRPYIVIPKENV